MNESVHFFLIVTFWLNVLGVFCRALLLALSDYPRTSETSQGMETVSLLFGGAWLFWVAWLLWGVS